MVERSPSLGKATSSNEAHHQLPASRAVGQHDLGQSAVNAVASVACGHLILSVLRAFRLLSPEWLRIQALALP
jgi:hypothetical protein